MRVSIDHTANKQITNNPQVALKGIIMITKGVNHRVSYTPQLTEAYY